MRWPLAALAIASRDNRAVQLRSVQPGEAIGAQRGEVVVCIPLYGGHEHFVACLQSVLAHTPAEVQILVCDDASPDRRSEQHVEALAGGARHRLLYMRRERNVGFPANVNDAFAGAAPADVVVLNSDCVVAEGWLEGLRDAAYLDATIATATTLTNHGTIVSVPEYCVPSPALPDGWTLEEAAAAVRARSLRLRPTLMTAVGHCMYVRRSALDLVGDFDLEFSPGYGEEVDFSQRCLAHGLRHVAADDVLVLHHAGGSFTTDGAEHPARNEHELLLLRRYPYYHDWLRMVEADVAGPLARAVGAARRALTGLRVVIDPRGAVGEGARHQARQLEAALSASGKAQVAALSATGAPRQGPTVDIVHRLFPVEDEHQLLSLARLGERLVLTHEDVSAYRDPSRWRSFTAWEHHRQLTATALAIADRVVFPTERARAAAIADELLEPERASVVAPGQERELVDVYEATCDAVASSARVLGAILRPEPAREPTLSEDALRLLGPGGALEPELERPLLALATHRGIARPLFGALKLGYRASSELRRLGRGRAGRPPL